MSISYTKIHQLLKSPHKILTHSDSQPTAADQTKRRYPHSYITNMPASDHSTVKNHIRSVAA